MLLACTLVSNNLGEPWLSFILVRKVFGARLKGRGSVLGKKKKKFFFWRSSRQQMRIAMTVRIEERFLSSPRTPRRTDGFVGSAGSVMAPGCWRRYIWKSDHLGCVLLTWRSFALVQDDDAVCCFFFFLLCVASRLSLFTSCLKMGSDISCPYTGCSYFVTSLWSTVFTRCSCQTRIRRVPAQMPDCFEAAEGAASSNTS